jgi:hypothetical protein
VGFTLLTTPSRLARGQARTTSRHRRKRLPSRHRRRRSGADNPDRRAPQRTPSASSSARSTAPNWDIKFIRHDPAGAPLVVLHDPDTHKYAVLDTEGELDENPVWHSLRP